MMEKHPHPLAAKLAELEERCRQLGKPLTVQRRTVLEVLLRRSDHPTTEDIYDQVEQQLPRVSRATVYRALETLVEFGLAIRVSHPGSATRYDSNTHRHHHLVCARCGKIRDFEAASLDRLRIPDTKALGFRVRDYSVDIRGICVGCTEAQTEPSDQDGRD
jgi:Fe2+ or Zn2+ uptake regulation protein